MTTTTPFPDSATTPVSDAGVELPPFTSYVHLVSIDPAENRYRFYRLQWHPPLYLGYLGVAVPTVSTRRGRPCPPVVLQDRPTALVATPVASCSPNSCLGH